MSDDDQSLAVPPRKDYDIVKLQDATVLEEFLEHPLTASLEAITGAFANGGKGLMVSAGRIAQGLVRGQIYEGLAYEWRRLREAGKLPENLGEMKHGLHTWAELMKIIDEECPDADRLEALKAAFYAVNKVNASDAERIQAYQLWQIAKQLRSGDIVLLKTLFRYDNHVDNTPDEQWDRFVGDKSGFGITELLALHVTKLRELLLVRQSGGHSAAKSQITNLGRHVCQNIQTYELDLKASSV